MKHSLTMLILLILTACNDNQQSQDLGDVDASIDKKQDIINAVKSESENLKLEKLDLEKVDKEKVNLEKPELIEFTYKDIEGQEVKLSDYRGKWVVVNFWATWCPPCRKEIPDFVKFKRLFADQVEILGIDSEDAELSTIQDFAFEYEINYPILMSDVYNPTDFERENSMGLPTTVIFNPKGEQVSKRVGPMHFKDLLEITGFVMKQEQESEAISE